MKRKRETAQFGTISHGTMRPEDLIPAFADELRRLRGALPRDLANDIRKLEANEYLDSDLADGVLKDLFDTLQEYAPDYGYFGAHPGDGSDYGFWLFEDFEQMMRDDGVLIVSDLSEVSDDYRGMVAVVNDHGNVTLYAKDVTDTLHELWSVV